MVCDTEYGAFERFASQRWGATVIDTSLGGVGRSVARALLIGTSPVDCCFRMDLADDGRRGAGSDRIDPVHGKFLTQHQRAGLA